jgi:hypothetical protein
MASEQIVSRYFVVVLTFYKISLLLMIHCETKWHNKWSVVTTSKGLVATL